VTPDEEVGSIMPEIGRDNATEFKILSELMLAVQHDRDPDEIRRLRLEHRRAVEARKARQAQARLAEAEAALEAVR
jgi:hypothetical protein